MKRLLSSARPSPLTLSRNASVSLSLEHSEFFQIYELVEVVVTGGDGEKAECNRQTGRDGVRQLHAEMRYCQ